VAQHYLLSPQARTLSLAKVLRLSDQEAYDTFKDIRWADNKGEPYCGKCGCADLYHLPRRKMWRCKGCNHQFSVTSGTIFASRKLSIRNYLAAIAIYVNGAKGYSALQLSRDLDVQYKTAFVLAHKLREVVASEQAKFTELSGEVEIDGGYFGGYIKPANEKKHRRDLRMLRNQNGKRECVVVMRERNGRGRTLSYVAKSEHAAIPTINATVKEGSTIFADEASTWDVLHSRYLTKRINHSERYADGEISTNMAESFFSRLRRAEIGIHHSVAGPYLSAYSAEMAWRENVRRMSNGTQYLKVTSAALAHPVSRQWKGYWQRRSAAI
jgi:transposase-like protein